MTETTHATIDYTPLSYIPTRQDIIAFQKQADYPVASWSSSPKMGILFGVIASLFLLIPAISIIRIMYVSRPIVAGLGLFLIMAIVLGMSGWYIARFFRQRRDKKLFVLTTFAKQNGFSYQATKNSPTHPGMIFSLGHSQRATDILFSTKGNLFEIGNYQYTTGSGKNQQVHNWGYVCIELERRLPNMVLDATSNNSNIFGLQLTNLPVSFKKEQTLSLEGDFNKFFTLYAPKEYERDALYVFTPDLMALLIDESSQFDVEVVDNRLYVYSKHRFDMLEQTTMKRLFAIIQVVGKKTIDQTDYYADERVGDRSVDIVAEPGRRLKHGVPVITIIIVVVYILYFIFSILS